jgi:hypothetical protein
LVDTVDSVYVSTNIFAFLVHQSRRVSNYIASAAQPFGCSCPLLSLPSASNCATHG